MIKPIGDKTITSIQQTLRQQGMGKGLVIKPGQATFEKVESLKRLPNLYKELADFISQKLKIEVVDILGDADGLLPILTAKPPFMERINKSNGNLAVLGHTVVIEMENNEKGKAYLLKDELNIAKITAEDGKNASVLKSKINTIIERSGEKKGPIDIFKVGGFEIQLVPSENDRAVFSISGLLSHHRTAIFPPIRVEFIKGDGWVYFDNLPLNEKRMSCPIWKIEAARGTDDRYETHRSEAGELYGEIFIDFSKLRAAIDALFARLTQSSDTTPFPDPVDPVDTGFAEHRATINRFIQRLSDDKTGPRQIEIEGCKIDILSAEEDFALLRISGLLSSTPPEEFKPIRVELKRDNGKFYFDDMPLTLRRYECTIEESAAIEGVYFGDIGNGPLTTLDLSKLRRIIGTLSIPTEDAEEGSVLKDKIETIN